MNSFVETSNYNDIDKHRVQPFKMDILDILLTLNAPNITPLLSKVR